MAVCTRLERSVKAERQRGIAIVATYMLGCSIDP